MGSPVIFKGKYAKNLAESGFLLKDGTVINSNGATNYASAYGFEDGTIGSATTYANTVAAATPEASPGGSVDAGFTFTVTSSSPLRGSYSGLITKPASNVQGHGVKFPLSSFDNADANKAIYVTIALEGSAAYETDTFKFYFQNGTDTPEEIRGSASGRVFTGVFFTGATVTDPAIIAHCTSASTTAMTLKMDFEKVGPDEIIDGPIKKYLGELTTTGTWTTNTTYTGRYWRDDDWLVGNVTVKTSGPPTAGLLEVSLPSGLTIDTNKLDITASERYIFSSGRAREDGVGNYPIAGVYATTTVLGLQTFGISTHTGVVPVRAYSAVTNTAPFNFDANDSITFSYRVPISEWANETALLSTSKLMNETSHLSVYIAAGQSIPNSGFNALEFDTVESESGGVFSLNTSTGVITVNESGKYKAHAQTSIDNLDAGASLSIRVYMGGSHVATDRQMNGTASVQDIYAAASAGWVDLNAGDTIYAAVAQDGAGSLNTFGGYQNTSLSVEKKSDFSVYGAPWTYELETATSSPFSLSTATYATGEYAQMSGNSVTLTEGVWKLSGGSKFIPGGSTTSLIIALWSLANGNDTTTAPTSISSVLTSGNDTMTYEPIGGFTVTKPMSEIVVTVTSETTVYLNHYVVFSVAGTASVTSYITAQRIRQ